MSEKNTYGPAEIIRLIAIETGALPHEVERLKVAWTQRIRRRLKDAGHKQMVKGKPRYATSLLGAQILIREMRVDLYGDLGRTHELVALESEERRAQQHLRDRREHFERTAPAEWLEAARRPAEAVVEAEEEPDPTPEYLEWLAQQEEGLKALNGIEESDELAFMLRAVFFHHFKGFDLSRFRDDYAERGRLSGALQNPGTGPGFEYAARKFNKLDDKLQPALSGMNLAAYLRGGK